jgi:hypothetical protein
MKISLSLHKIYYFRASLRQDLPEKTPTDKSNAIKTIINFLSFVKPLKTGTNYARHNQKHHYRILQGCTHSQCAPWYLSTQNKINRNHIVIMFLS